LVRPSEHRKIADIAMKAEKMGFLIRTQSIADEEEIGRKLSQLLDEIDVLLAQPDIKIYNRKTVSKILLSSYRKHIPVIGYSSSYVKAGALAAVYSSPEDIGRDIGESVVYYLRHHSLYNDSIYPRFFSISLNRKVGDSLGLRMDSKPDDIVKYIQDNEL